MKPGFLLFVRGRATSDDQACAKDSGHSTPTKSSIALKTTLSRPFLPRVIWAPSGYNLTWAAAAPGASVLAAPLTLTQGVVVTYNVLALLAPVLGAWTAYVLCRYVTKNVPASLVGGYLFGFSTYELNHLKNHLKSIPDVPDPRVVYLVLLRMAGEIRPFAFVLLFAAALVLQFLFMPEVSATLTLNRRL